MGSNRMNAINDSRSIDEGDLHFDHSDASYVVHA
jgi:hypothetical protein